MLDLALRQTYILSEPRPFPLIIAHRGASGYAPENTMAAFEKALALKADMIELDIRPTADQQAIVYHDKELKRTTGKKGRVGKLNLSQLTAMQATHGFRGTGFGEEKIPSLGEVLARLQGRCRLLLEIKAEGQRTSLEFLIHVGRLCNAVSGPDWIVIQSFDSIILQRFHKLFPEYEIHKLLVFRLPVFNVQLDRSLKVEDALKSHLYRAINVDHRFVSPRFISKVHRMEKKVFCWTVNDPVRMAKLIDWKVDGIITNYPDRLEKLRPAYVNSTL